eukprot:6736399-Pyramimonas_sp.AAC.1
MTVLEPTRRQRAANGLRHSAVRFLCPLPPVDPLRADEVLGIPLRSPGHGLEASVAQLFETPGSQCFSVFHPFGRRQDVVVAVYRCLRGAGPVGGGNHRI